MAKNRINLNFFIGLFLISGFFLLGIGLVWFGAEKFFKESSYYATYFDGSVEGISKGTPVKYLGIPVGSVFEVRLAPDGRMVEIVMVLEKNLEIRDSMRVKIEFTSLTGGRFLQLFYPTDPYILERHPKLPFKPNLAVIPSAPSGIETLEAGIREAANKILEFQFRDVSQSIVNFLNTADNFLKNENLSETFTNFKLTSENLRSLSQQLDTTRIISVLGNASLNILQITKKLENFADTLNKEAQMLKLSEKVDNTLTRVDSLVDLGKQIAFVVASRVELASFSLNELINGLKKSNSLMQKMLLEYTQNPGQLLLSEPPPEE
ncbi:MAG: MlaD family protein [Ignavibacteria bacterium]|nr:MlaD family protein [Ignavibacteria bacterium]